MNVINVTFHYYSSSKYQSNLTFDFTGILQVKLDYWAYNTDASYTCIFFKCFHP